MFQSTESLYATESFIKRVLKRSTSSESRALIGGRARWKVGKEKGRSIALLVQATVFFLVVWLSNCIVLFVLQYLVTVYR